jgi:hypothetical protein
MKINSQEIARPSVDQGAFMLIRDNKFDEFTLLDKISKINMTHALARLSATIAKALPTVISICPVKAYYYSQVIERVNTIKDDTTKNPRDLIHKPNETDWPQMAARTPIQHNQNYFNQGKKNLSQKY